MERPGSENRSFAIFAKRMGEIRLSFSEEQRVWYSSAVKRKQEDK